MDELSSARRQTRLWKLISAALAACALASVIAPSTVHARLPLVPQEHTTRNVNEFGLAGELDKLTRDGWTISHVVSVAHAPQSGFGGDPRFLIVASRFVK
jgi:hypothetical protein